MPIKTKANLLLMNVPVSPAERTAEKRRIRKHQILDSIRRLGPLSRVDVANDLGFNLPTVSSLVDDLVVEGLVIEDKAKPTSIGRRPIPLRLNENAACVMGIDIGKTRTIGLLMNIGGTILTRIEEGSDAFEGVFPDAQWVDGFCNRLFASYEGELPLLAGIGVGLPGLIYRAHSGERKIMEPYAQLIKDGLEARFKVPAIVLNVARMMAFGIRWFGQDDSEEPVKNFAAVALGYGLSMGSVIDNHLFLGSHGHAGEFGHLPLGEPGVECYCGGNCCLENIVSGSGLERMATQAGLVEKGKQFIAEELAQRARSGDSQAQDIWNRFADALARGIGTIICLHNPGKIYLAGRVAHAADVFMPRLQETLARTTVAAMVQETEVTVTPLMDEAGSLGTCACVLHHIFYASHINAEDVV